MYARLSIAALACSTVIAPALAQNYPSKPLRFLAQGALASGIPPDEFVSFMKIEMEKWAKVARFADIRLD